MPSMLSARESSLDRAVRHNTFYRCCVRRAYNTSRFVTLTGALIITKSNNQNGGLLYLQGPNHPRLDGSSNSKGAEVSILKDSYTSYVLCAAGKQGAPMHYYSSVLHNRFKMRRRTLTTMLLPGTYTYFINSQTALLNKVFSVGELMGANEAVVLNQGKNCAVLRSGIHGYGLYATGIISANERIIEYTGVIITPVMSDLLETRLKQLGFSSTYMFTINDCQVVDATFAGNGARFANHSCTPNAKVIVLNNKLYLQSIKPIYPGDEICYNYMLRMDPSNRIPCYCGSKECFGYMDTQEK